MAITLVLIVLGGLLAVGLFIAGQWKRYRIRHTGKLVTVKVTRVQMWQDPPKADISLQSKLIPFLGGRWWYEIYAEWTDPLTNNTSILTSGPRKGLPMYQQGDYLAAYVSPYGDYLKLSSPLLR